MNVPHFSGAVVGCMATFPDRFPTLSRVINCIAPQLDHLYVYVNQSVVGLPTLRGHGNVTFLDGNDFAGDISANGKVYPLRYLSKCRVFLFDDDFIYPPDYVKKYMNIFDLFGGMCAITTHGGILPPQVDWYYERTHVFMSTREVKLLQLCSLAGSGTFAFDQRYLKPDPDEFLEKVWVDLKMSLLARSSGLPIWVVPRHRNWLKSLPMEGLWQKFSRLELTHHTVYAREVDWSFQNYAKIAMQAIQEAGLQLKDLNLDPELLICLKKNREPNIWRSNLLRMRKYSSYMDIVEAGCYGGV